MTKRLSLTKALTLTTGQVLPKGTIVRECDWAVPHDGAVLCEIDGGSIVLMRQVWLVPAPTESNP